MWISKKKIYIFLPDSLHIADLYFESLLSNAMNAAFVRRFSCDVSVCYLFLKSNYTWSQCLQCSFSHAMCLLANTQADFFILLIIRAIVGLL